MGWRSRKAKERRESYEEREDLRKSMSDWKDSRLIWELNLAEYDEGLDLIKEALVRLLRRVR